MQVKAHQVFCKIQCLILVGPPRFMHEVSRLRLEGSYKPPTNVPDCRKLRIKERWDRATKANEERAQGLPPEGHMFGIVNRSEQLEVYAETVASELHIHWWRKSPVALQAGLLAELQISVHGMTDGAGTCTVSYQFDPLIMPAFRMLTQTVPETVAIAGTG